MGKGGVERGGGRAERKEREMVTGVAGGAEVV